MLWIRLVFISCLALMTISGSTSVAQQPSTVKLVETAVVGRVTDRWGQPMHFPNGLQMIFFKFHSKSWEPKLWAHIPVRPDADGKFQSSGVFPIDSVFMIGLINHASGRDRAKIDVGLQALDARGQPMHFPNGLRVELSQYGRQAWPPGTVAVMSGSPDDLGRMWPKMDIPVNAITLRNFTLLAQGKGM